jgi:hypothetical protein
VRSFLLRLTGTGHAEFPVVLESIADSEAYAKAATALELIGSVPAMIEPKKLLCPPHGALMEIRWQVIAWRFLRNATPQAHTY